MASNGWQPFQTGMAGLMVSKSRKAAGVSMAESASVSPSSAMSVPDAYAPGLPGRGTGEAHVGGEVVDGLVPVGDEGLGALSDAVERRDVVLGENGPAAGHERALVGVGAVRAGLHVGEGALDRVAEPLNLGGNAREERLGLSGHVGPGEEVRQVGEGALRVQMHEVGALHVEAGGTEDVELDCDVGVVGLLHLGGGLHLDEVPAAAPALEHVDRDEDAVGEEGGLEDGRGAVGDGAPGLLDLSRPRPGSRHRRGRRRGSAPARPRPPGSPGRRWPAARRRVSAPGPWARAPATRVASCTGGRSSSGTWRAGGGWARR